MKTKVKEIKLTVFGFTLIELLSVIVILTIILAIAIPSVKGIVDGSTRKSFESSLNLIFRGIDYKVLKSHTYNPTIITEENIESELGIAAHNYQSVRVIIDNSLITLTVVGKNIWKGLTGVISKDGFLIDDARGQVSTDTSYFTFDEVTRTITKYNYASGPTNVVIPSTINGVPVEHIGPGAFVKPVSQWCIRTNYNLPEVSRPLSYVHTEGDGFIGCYYGVSPSSYPVTSVVFPKYLKTIGQTAFANNKLTNVTFPDGLKRIDTDAFYYNDITSVVFPNSLTYIGAYAFSGNLLNNITLPNSITKIAFSAFMYNHLTSVKLSEGLTSIDPYVFSDNFLGSLSIPDNITTIGEGAFYINLLQSIVIPNSVTTIGEGVFSDNKLTSITFSNKLTTIPIASFGINNLTSLSIPSGITTIGDQSFVMNQIADLFIPTTVTSIGSAAFNANHLPPKQAFIYERKLDGTNNEERVVSYGGLNKSDIEVPINVKTICPYAFIGNEISSIILQEGITNIEEGAFVYNNLESISIPASVNSIGNYALRDNRLTTIVMGKTGTAIGSQLLAFNNGFRTAYQNVETGGAGTYTGTQKGSTWTKN